MVMVLPTQQSIFDWHILSRTHYGILSPTVTPRFPWLIYPASRASGIFCILMTRVTSVIHGVVSAVRCLSRSLSLGYLASGVSLTPRAHGSVFVKLPLEFLNKDSLSGRA
jgi:hypothetical protein